MKILFLGSGGREFWPSAFCGCRDCTAAVAGANTHRVGACVLVDDRFLFDLPPNVHTAALRLNTSLAQVQHLFVTHSHQDHFDPCTLAAAGRNPEHPLHLYCNRRVADLLPLYARFNRFFGLEKLGIMMHVLSPFDSVTAGEDGAPFELISLRADHDRTGSEDPLLYIFKRNGKTLLYACDTGWFPDETWQEVQKHSFDLVMLDCALHTVGDCRVGHLSIEHFLAAHERFKSQNLLNPDARFVAHHLAAAHSGDNPSHEMLVERFRPHGVDVACDGLVLQV